MRRPVLSSGEAKVIVYASRAGEKVTAWDLIKACENRERNMRKTLQWQGKLVTRTYRLANDDGDIVITCDWVELGVKDVKRVRRARASLKTAHEPL